MTNDDLIQTPALETYCKDCGHRLTSGEEMMFGDRCEECALFNPAESKVTTFKNKNFTKRDYECTNIVACQARTAPDDNWVPADESVLVGLTQLWIEGGVRYFGYM